MTDYQTLLLEALEEGTLNAEALARTCISWLGETETEQMVRNHPDLNGFTDCIDCGEDKDECTCNANH